MSDFLAESPRDTLSLTPAGTLEPITDETIALAKKILAPGVLRRLPDFFSFIKDSLSLDPADVPLYQVTGFPQFIVQFKIDAGQQTSNTDDAWIDLSNPALQVTGVSPGKYLVFYGSGHEHEGTSGTVQSDLSVNGASPAILNAATSTIGTRMSVMAVREVDFTATQTNNTIKLQGRKVTSPSNANAIWTNRFLAVWRFSNP